MRTFIQASELALTEEEMRSRLSPEKLSSIAREGGVLQAYALAHEGESRPRVIGEGKARLRWTRAVIHRLAEKVREGTKFFLGHGRSNSHEGRQSVGEVLSSFVKEVGGKLANVVIGYFPDRRRVEAMDVCSMEADVSVDGELVEDVNEVSAIAIGSSDRESPAFPGAMRLSMVQCFDQDKTGEEDESMAGEADKKITFEDVKRAIRDMNIHPWQLYSVDDMRDDRHFGKIFEENATLKSENERLKKSQEELTVRSTEAIRKGEVAEAGKRLDVLMAEGYTDKQREYIKRQFNPEAHKDLTEEGLKKFLDGAKKEYADMAKLFGSGTDGGERGTGGEGSRKRDEESSDSGNMEEQALDIIAGRDAKK